MTLLLTSGSKPYHTSIEHTAPHRRGGANQKDHRSHSTGGGGDEAKQDQTGKATNSKKTTTRLTGKGDTMGRGGRGGVAALHHIYIYMYIHTCLYIYICVERAICVSIYIYIYMYAINKQIRVLSPPDLSMTRLNSHYHQVRSNRTA